MSTLSLGCPYLHSREVWRGRSGNRKHEEVFNKQLMKRKEGRKEDQSPGVVVAVVHCARAPSDGAD